tara:strand:- start:72 stop:605 length:534 start_codon:yes stop_codon:yes gene_type:complete
MSNILKKIGEGASAMKKTVLGDRCNLKKKNNLWNDLQLYKNNTDKLGHLLDAEMKKTHLNLEKDMEKLAKYKDFSECPDDVNLEAAKLVIAHENAIAEINNPPEGLSKESAENMPNGQYPQYKNWQLASEDFIIRKIQEKKTTAGGKKRKYKRKTNKRKTNKRKTNKRKTYKKRTKK